jgi:hypothetical protein
MFGDVVEEIVEADEIHALEVPVGVLRLRSKDERVRESPVELLDYLDPNLLR